MTDAGEIGSRPPRQDYDHPIGPAEIEDRPSHDPGERLLRRIHEIRNEHEDSGEKIRSIRIEKDPDRPGNYNIDVVHDSSPADRRPSDKKDRVLNGLYELATKEKLPPETKNSRYSLDEKGLEDSAGNDLLAAAATGPAGYLVKRTVRALSEVGARIAGKRVGKSLGSHTPSRPGSGLADPGPPSGSVTGSRIGANFNGSGTGAPAKGGASLGSGGGFKRGAGVATKPLSPDDDLARKTARDSMEEYSNRKFEDFGKTGGRAVKVVNGTDSPRNVTGGAITDEGSIVGKTGREIHEDLGLSGSADDGITVYRMDSELTKHVGGKLEPVKRGDHIYGADEVAYSNTERPSGTWVNPDLLREPSKTWRDPGLGKERLHPGAEGVSPGWPPAERGRGVPEWKVNRMVPDRVKIVRDPDVPFNWKSGKSQHGTSHRRGRIGWIDD